MNLRHLPCSKCGDATTSVGHPYFMATAPIKWPARYRCGCGQHMTLSVAQWNALPALTPEEYERRLPAGGEARALRDVSQRVLPIKPAKPGLGALVVAPPLKDVKLPIAKEKRCRPTADTSTS